MGITECFLRSTEAVDLDRSRLVSIPSSSNSQIIHNSCERYSQAMMQFITKYHKNVSTTLSRIVNLQWVLLYNETARLLQLLVFLKTVSKRRTNFLFSMFSTWLPLGMTECFLRSTKAVDLDRSRLVSIPSSSDSQIVHNSCERYSQAMMQFITKYHKNVSTILAKIVNF